MMFGVDLTIDGDVNNGAYAAKLHYGGVVGRRLLHGGLCSGCYRERCENVRQTLLNQVGGLLSTTFCCTMHLASVA
jgi:hypothetical protein